MLRSGSCLRIINASLSYRHYIIFITSITEFNIWVFIFVNFNEYMLVLCVSFQAICFLMFYFKRFFLNKTVLNICQFRQAFAKSKIKTLQYSKSNRIAGRSTSRFFGPTSGPTSKYEEFKSKRRLPSLSRRYKLSILNNSNSKVLLKMVKIKLETRLQLDFYPRSPSKWSTAKSKLSLRWTKPLKINRFSFNTRNSFSNNNKWGRISCDIRLKIKVSSNNSRTRRKTSKIKNQS